MRGYRWLGTTHPREAADRRRTSPFSAPNTPLLYVRSTWSSGTSTAASIDAAAWSAKVASSASSTLNDPRRSDPLSPRSDFADVADSRGEVVTEREALATALFRRVQNDPSLERRCAGSEA